MRYIVVPINQKLESNDGIFYTSDDYNKALEFYYDYDGYCDICIYDKSLKIVRDSDYAHLYSVYSSGRLICVCEDYKKYLEQPSKYYRLDYTVYNNYGKIIYKCPKHIEMYGIFPHFITDPIKDKEISEKVKEKSSISLEINGFDELSNIEKVKTLETICENLRKKNSNITISDDFLKDVRFTVRKSFEDKEKNFYTDLETATLSCPVGYFDVITGDCVYVKEKSIYDFKKEAEEGMKYKEMWNELHGNLKYQIDTLRNDNGSVGSNMRTAYRLTLESMEKLEKEAFKNE